MIFQKLLFFAAALLAFASLADFVGVAFRASWLTRAGAHLSVSAIVVASLCLGWWVTRLRTSRRGWVLWIAAIVCFALARWLRGSAGVSPDAPLIAAELIGALLALAAVRRHLRAKV